MADTIYISLFSCCDIYIFSLLTSDYESFIFLLVMHELKSQFEVFAIWNWLKIDLGHTVWDFRHSYIAPLRKYGNDFEYFTFDYYQNYQVCNIVSLLEVLLISCTCR